MTIGQRFFASLRTTRVRVALAVALLTAPCLSQSPADRGRLLPQLLSRDWTQRAAAFTQLGTSPDVWHEPAMRSALLELLRQEQGVIAQTLRESAERIGVAERFGEGYAEYEADVLDTCVRYCDRDPLLNVLLGLTRSGLSSVRHDAVRVLGEIADRGFSTAQQARIDSTLVAAANDRGNWFTRTAGIEGLMYRLLRDRRLPEASRAALHAVIIAAATDSSPQIRISAAQALGELGDARDLPLLRRIAATDPDSSINRGKVRHTVREAAAWAIARIERR